MILVLKRLVDGATSNNLHIVIVHTLIEHGGLDEEEIASKLICFGVADVFVF